MIRFIVIVLIALVIVSPAHAQTASPTGQPTVPASVFMLGGPVYMGSVNVEVTEPLTYTLSVFRADPVKASKGDLADSISEAYHRETKIDGRGRYEFADVPLLPNDLYVITTQYAGITQGTVPYTYDGRTPPGELPITLYAGSSTPDKLSIVQTQQVLSFVSPGVMRVLETITVQMGGDRFYRSTQKARNGDAISLSFPLPVGARAIAFNTLPTTRFVVAGDPNTPIIQDTKAVMPGLPQDVTFSYQLPYTSGAPIDRDYLYPIGKLTITLPTDASIGVLGLPFTVSQVKAGDTGRDLTQYSVEKPVLRDGKRLIFTLDGRAKNPEVSAPVSGFNPILVLAVIAGFVFLIIGGLSMVRWRARARADDS